MTRITEIGGGLCVAVILTVALTARVLDRRAHRRHARYPTYDPGARHAD